MTGRDRIVLLVVAMGAVLAGFWFVVLGPKRDEAQALTAKVVVEQQRLDLARASAQSATQARLSYTEDYATVARLGKAVPVEDDVPSLLYQLETVARAHRIDFRSIRLEARGGSAAAAAPPAAQAVALDQAAKGTDGAAPPQSGAAGTTTPAATGTPAAATQVAVATLPPGAVVGSAGFPTMPFAFGFDGRFFDLEAFLRSLDKLTYTQGKEISVRGRLLTIDGIALTAGRKGFPRVRASISATAYLLPAEQGLTGGATPSGPAPAIGGATPQSSSPTPTAAITP